MSERISRKKKKQLKADYAIFQKLSEMAKVYDQALRNNK